MRHGPEMREFQRGYETGDYANVYAHVCCALHHGSSGVCQKKTFYALGMDSPVRENVKIMVFIKILNCFLMVAEHIVFSAPRTECFSMLRISNRLDYIQVNVKLPLYRPWRSLGLRLPHFQTFGSQMAAKLSAPCAGRPLPPRKIPGTHFC
jgi:hypothetical protein